MYDQNNDEERKGGGVSKIYDHRITRKYRLRRGGGSKSLVIFKNLD